MKLLRHRKLANGAYRVAVWVDESRTQPDGTTPDPTCVLVFTFPPAPAGISDAVWERAMRIVVRERLPSPDDMALAQARMFVDQQTVWTANALNNGTPVTGEGDTLT